jgi:hypothetical protein
VSFAAITLCVSSQRVLIVVVYFVFDSVRKLLDTPSYIYIYIYLFISLMYLCLFLQNNSPCETAGLQLGLCKYRKLCSSVSGISFVGNQEGRRWRHQLYIGLCS